MNRYQLQSIGYYDRHTATFVSFEDVWLTHVETGDVSHLIDHLSTLNLDPDELVLHDNMEVTVRDDAESGAHFKPVIGTFVNDPDSYRLIRTDKFGLSEVEYKAREGVLVYTRDGVYQSVRFDRHGGDRTLSFDDIEGRGDDEKLEKLKGFMVKLSEAFTAWED